MVSPVNVNQKLHSVLFQPFSENYVLKFRSWKCENIHTTLNHKLWICTVFLFCFALLLCFAFCFPPGSFYTFMLLFSTAHETFIINKRAFLKKILAWWACKFSVLKFYYWNNILWLTDTRITKGNIKKNKMVWDTRNYRTIGQQNKIRIIT